MLEWKRTWKLPCISIYIYIDVFNIGLEVQGGVGNHCIAHGTIIGWCYGDPSRCSLLKLSKFRDEFEGLGFEVWGRTFRSFRLCGLGLWGLV